jgi:peroxiredoxin
MAQFESHKDEILGKGSLVFIAAQKRASALSNPEKFLASHPISFPYLLDEDRTVTKSYGVYKALGTDSINIARPATFVIDSGGKIRYLYVGSNQLDRAPIEKVLEAYLAAARGSAAHHT